MTLSGTDPAARPDVSRHPVLGEEVVAIGGRYRLDEERRLEVGGREVLYALGTVELDSACCGPGGGTYAVVAGFVRALRFGRDPEGRDLSRVEPIPDDPTRDRIRRLIEARDGVGQVTFR